MTAKHLVAYAIIFLAIAAGLAVLVRRWRRKPPRYVRFDLTDRENDN